MIRLLRGDNGKANELNVAEELAKERYLNQLALEHKIRELEREKNEAINLAVKQAVQQVVKEMEVEKKRIKQEKMQESQLRLQAEQEKMQESQLLSKKEQEREQISQLLFKKEQEIIKNRIKSITKMLVAGLDLEAIAEFSNSSVAEVKGYIEMINRTKR